MLVKTTSILSTSKLKLVGQFGYTPMTAIFSGVDGFQVAKILEKSPTGIAKMYGGFEERVRPIQVKKCRERVLTYHDLGHPVFESDLESENNGRFNFSITADCLHALLMNQWKGDWKRDMPLHTDGRINIVPVTDRFNRLCIVRADWRKGWHLTALDPQRHTLKKGTRVLMGPPISN